MKRLLTLVLSLALIMMAAAPAMAEAPVQIEFWHSFGSGANLEALEKIIADFNELNAGKYEVVGTYQGNYAEILGKLTVGYAADETPAISFVDSVDVPQLINMGMLTNMSDYAAENDPEYDFSVFIDGLMNYGTGPEGDYYALPMGRSTPLMYLNMDLIKEATGEEKIPANREEFVEVLTAVRDNTEANPFSCPLICWYFANFTTTAGYGFISADGQTCYLKDGALQALEFWKQLQDDGLYVAPPVGNDSWVNEQFQLGNTAIIFQSTGNLTSMMETCEFDLQAGFLPADEKYSVATGGNNLVIPNKASAEEVAGAWEFAKYCTSLEVNAFVNEATGYILTHKDSAELESVQKLWEEKPLYKVAYDQLQYVEDLYVSPYFAELNLEVVNLVSAMLQDDQLTPQEAYDQLMVVCDRLFPGGNISQADAQ